MPTVEVLILSTNEQQSFEIIRQVEEGKIDRALACELLDISPRTLCRYIKRYRERGLLFLRHGNRSRKPANAHPYEIRASIHRLMKEVLYDFNMTHARQLIEEKFEIKIPRETFRRWCHQINAVKKRHRRRAKPRHHRTRQSQMGLMLQFDGSPHQWFGTEVSCLIAGIDDASSKLLWAQFGESENTRDCMHVLKAIIQRYGVFRVLYVDRAGLYGGIKRSGFSQIARALGELGVKVIYAQSPEGKGRVERLFRTLQDRLIPELRLNKITSLTLANRYLQDIYLPDHNRRFAVTPANPIMGFRELSERENLDRIFCIKESRKVGKDHTVSIKSAKWRVSHPENISIAGRCIEIHMHDAKTEAFLMDQKLTLEKIENIRHDKIAG